MYMLFVYALKILFCEFRDKPARYATQHYKQKSNLSIHRRSKKDFKVLLKFRLSS